MNANFKSLKGKSSVLNHCPERPRLLVSVAGSSDEYYDSQHEGQHDSQEQPQPQPPEGGIG